MCWHGARTKMEQHRKYPEDQGTAQESRTDGILCKNHSQHPSPNTCDFPFLDHLTPTPKKWTTLRGGGGGDGRGKWPQKWVQGREGTTKQWPDRVANMLQDKSVLGMPTSCMTVKYWRGYAVICNTDLTVVQKSCIILPKAVSIILATDRPEGLAASPLAAHRDGVTWGRKQKMVTTLQINSSGTIDKRQANLWCQIPKTISYQIHYHLPDCNCQTPHNVQQQSMHILILICDLLPYCLLPATTMQHEDQQLPAIILYIFV